MEKALDSQFSELTQTLAKSEQKQFIELYDGAKSAAASASCGELWVA